ncbi:MAG: hypothetical protein QXG00_01080 [Candidatus Woesearchaeota archaeon]
MVKKKRAYKCPHCKKKIYIEDLEPIEDTAAFSGVKELSSFKPRI